MGTQMTPPLVDRTFLVTAARGTEMHVCDELRDLGLEHVEELRGAVRFRGSIEDAMRVCMWSRVGMRVMLELGRDRIRNDQQLYASVRSLPLSNWFGPDHTIAVFARTSGRQFRNSRYVALKVKDAIVDDVRDRVGRRPNVDPKSPDLSVSVHISGQDVSYFIELHGQPLNQRGYRVRDVEAPLKETLAAALLRLSGWDGEAPLHDPFCGAGTIIIEGGR